VPPDPEPTDAPRVTASAEWTLCRGSPLARGLPRGFHWPLALLVSCAIAMPLAVLALASGLLPARFFPAAAFLSAALASWPLALAWTRHAARREAARVEVFADRVRLSSRRGEIVFPVATTRATVDVRETMGNWRSGTESQVWTIVLLESGSNAYSLGTLSPKARRSGRIGVPMHACDRETLRAVAALWSVEIPEPQGARHRHRR
jgi:hypothetical protein